MLTEKEVVLLYAKSVRELIMEIKSLEYERTKCFNSYRRRWIDSRISKIQEVINVKNLG